MTFGPPTFLEHVAACWQAALATWGVAIELSPPQSWQADRAEHWGGDEPLAYIDLVVRQVVVNFDLLARIDATGSLEAVLAHEIGHHVRFPHTLGLAAQLEVLQRQLLPFYGPSLTNLFFDLQVNEWVGRDRAEQLQAVYRGFVRRDAQLSPLFAFYLATYEELWGLEPGDLAGPAAEACSERYPGFRAEARMFAQTFWSLGDVHLQFVYFCSVVARYLPESPSTAGLPMASDLTRPDLDDYAGAVYGNASMDRALDEAMRRGWIEEGQAGDGQPLATIGRIAGGLPGSEAAAFRRALVSKHYRRLVDEHLIDVPTLPDEREPERLVPSTTEPWEWGDNPGAIDWTASVVAAGLLAPAMPLQRTLLATDPDPRGLGVPSFEIYLDTSGSMPDPSAAVNAMTLAAQVLAAAALRKGGRVRAIVYSYGDPKVSEWLYDEEVARDFLLYYAGGGTLYPFDVLADSAEQNPGAIRVVISDGDFLYNLAQEGAIERLQLGIGRSRRFVAMLALYAGAMRTAQEKLAPVLSDPGFRLVVVDDLGKLAAAARDLAGALFDLSR